MKKPASVAAIAALLGVLAAPASAQMGEGRAGHMMQGSGMMKGSAGQMSGGPGMMMHGDRMYQGMMMPNCGMGGGAMMGMGPMMGKGAMMQGGSMHIEGRIAFLKAELGITADQEAQWTVFADAMRASAGTMRSMHETMMSGDGPPRTLPERMEWHEQMMAQRLEQLRSMREAAGPLYDVLTAGQKEMADTLMMGMM
jgi:hypothetical protein